MRPPAPPRDAVACETDEPFSQENKKGTIVRCHAGMDIQSGLDEMEYPRGAGGGEPRPYGTISTIGRCGDATSALRSRRRGVSERGGRGKALP